MGLFDWLNFPILATQGNRSKIKKKCALGEYIRERKIDHLQTEEGKEKERERSVLERIRQAGKTMMRQEIHTAEDITA